GPLDRRLRRFRRRPSHPARHPARAPRRRPPAPAPPPTPRPVTRDPRPIKEPSLTHALPFAAALLPLAACASTSTFSPAAPMRAGAGVPARFDPPAGFERILPADTISGSSCLNGLRDPRDGTTLRMVRSEGDQADDEADGRYGTAESELIRIEWNTG